jgi:hypothetical protein
MSYREPYLSKEAREFQDQETGLIFDLDDLRDAINRRERYISECAKKGAKNSKWATSEIESVKLVARQIIVLRKLLDDGKDDLEDFREEYKSKNTSSTHAQSAEDQPPTPKVLTASERRSSIGATAE